MPDQYRNTPDVPAPAESEAPTWSRYALLAALAAVVAVIVLLALNKP